MRSKKQEEEMKVKILFLSKTTISIVERIHINKIFINSYKNTNATISLHVKFKIATTNLL